MINLKSIPKESGVYWFVSDNRVIYVGSSYDLYQRITEHNSNIRKGSNHGCQKDFYQFLQQNEFTIEFQLTDNYKQLEQELIEKHQPIFNAYKAFTGISLNGNRAEYDKEYYQKYKEEVRQQQKQYYQEHNEEILEQRKRYANQLCNYNNETLTLAALKMRLKRRGIEHPTLEAKKYLIK